MLTVTEEALKELKEKYEIIIELDKETYSDPQDLGDALDAAMEGFEEDAGFILDGLNAFLAGAYVAAEWQEALDTLGSNLGVLPATNSTISYTSGGVTHTASYINSGGGGGADAGQAAYGGAGTAGSGGTTVTGRATSQTTYSSGGVTHTATSVTGGGGGGADSGQAANPEEDSTATEDRRPILLDLDGNGVKITEFGTSTQFTAGKDGLQHRSSWAGTGDGVLFFDPDGRNAITEARQYVFTDWAPTAQGDLEAIRQVWDSNGDGKLTSADAEFAKFKVMVTGADGQTSVKTLAELGITEIDLTANATEITLPDGSRITGQTTFTRANGTTGTVANTTLVTDAAGYPVEEGIGADGVNRVVTQTDGLCCRWRDAAGGVTVDLGLGRRGPEEAVVVASF